MTERQKKIHLAFQKLPTAAIMQGCKASIACDVTTILNRTEPTDDVDYDEIVAAENAHTLRQQGLEMDLAERDMQEDTFDPDHDHSQAWDGGFADNH